MAKAATIKKVEPYTQTHYRTVRAGVHLELTPAEAVALRSLFRKVGGHPDSTARNYTNKIDTALADQQVPYANYVVSGTLFVPGSDYDVLAAGDQWRDKADEDEGDQ